MPNRSDILRTAHARVHHLRARFHWWTYRELLAEEMRRAWADAKAAADRLSFQPVVMTAEQIARFRELADAAWMQPITRVGNMRHAAMMDAAIRLQVSHV